MLLELPSFIPNLTEKIKIWEDEWVTDCVEGYCQIHSQCKGTNGCTRELCRKICERWVKKNKHQVSTPYLGSELNEFLRGELGDVKSTQDAKKIKKRRDEEDANQKTLAFCIDWKDKTSSNPYSDSTVKADIRQVGSLWRGIKKAPTKEECLALEMEAILGKKDKEEGKEEIKSDVDLEELQGDGKEGEPRGTTVEVEIQSSKGAFLDNSYMITDYGN